jgi:hypothetical protein
LHDVSSNQVVVGTNNNVECYLQPKEDSYIEIVDVDFDINKDGYYLDIKLRNSGDKIAFIKKIIFNMHDVFAMPNPQITQYSLVLPTATYDIVLNGEKQQAFSLSQSVGANDVDRFKIKIASSIAETRMVTVYYFSFILCYDENRKTAESQKYISAFPSKSEWNGCYVSHTSMEIAKENYLQLLRISQLDGIKSKKFLDILKSYEDSKRDFM